MQQEHRIGAARHSHAHPLPGLEHAMSRNEFGYAVEHSVRMIPRRTLGQSSSSFVSRIASKPMSVKAAAPAR